MAAELVVDDRGVIERGAGHPVARRLVDYADYGLIALIALVYVALIGRYRAYDLDNVWFLSFSYSFWVQHVNTDTFMLMPFPNGMGGVIAFGKLAAMTQGVVLSRLGWTLVAGTGISILFVVIALCLLTDMCRQMGYSERFRLCFVALLGLSEPVVFMSQKTRYEFLAFFLLALALWFVARRHTAAAMFVAALAAEVEPAAVVIPLAVAVALLMQRRGLERRVAKIAGGVAAAAVVYLLLHPDIVSVIGAAHWNSVSAGSFPGGFVAYYYLHYKRHLADLALLMAAIAAALVWRRRLLTEWPALCAMTIVLASAVLRWGNVPYFGLITPFLLLFVLQALYVERYWRWILAGILLWMLPQYAFRYHFWAVRDAGFSQAEERQVGEALERVAARVGVAPAELKVMGNFNLWYAHPGRFVNLDRRLLVSGADFGAGAYLCFDRLVDPILAPVENDEAVCSQLDGIARPVETLNLHGHVLEVRMPLR